MRTQSTRTEGKRARCLGAFFFGFAILVISKALLAQDVPFNPRLDALDDTMSKRVKTPIVQEPTKHQTVYSYARFALSFKVLCAGLEGDERKDRVYRVSKAALGEEFGCSSCRALYRQLVNACEPKVGESAIAKKKPSPAPTATVVAAETQGVADDQEKQDSEDPDVQSDEKLPEVIPSAAVPEPPHQPARYPRTDVLDAASRISASLYELEPGSGSTFKALQNFERRLLAVPDLTPAEKDYFGILLSYLFSAWEGRPGSPLDPRVKTKEDVSVLFQ